MADLTTMRMITERDVQNHKQLTTAEVTALLIEGYCRWAGLPSAADLDAVAEEERIKQATGGEQMLFCAHCLDGQHQHCNGYVDDDTTLCDCEEQGTKCERNKCPECGARLTDEGPESCLNIWHGSDVLESRPGWRKERARLHYGGTDEEK